MNEQGADAEHDSAVDSKFPGFLLWSDEHNSSEDSFFLKASFHTQIPKLLSDAFCLKYKDS